MTDKELKKLIKEKSSFRVINMYAGGYLNLTKKQEKLLLKIREEEKKK